MFTQFCVYTIKRSSYLCATVMTGGKGAFSERKAWKTAARLVAVAKQDGERVPLIFSPAEGTRYLFAWALLDRVTITSSGTTRYTFSGLTLFEGKPTLKTVLRKRSNREPLHKNFIRPYAICYTPKFLTD